MECDLGKHSLLVFAYFFFQSTVLASTAGAAVEEHAEDGDSKCQRCVWGVIPYPVIAVALCVFGSILTVCGFALQKVASQRASSRWPRLGDIVLSPLWVAGFVLAIVLPLPGNIVAYALAPMSLLAPISGVTTLVNFVLAPYLLGEKLQLWPDLAASALILVGTVLATAFGDHGEQSVAVDEERLYQLFFDRLFLIALACLLLVLMAGLTCTYSWRARIQEAATARPANPPMHQVMLPAFMYAGFGCVTNVALKAVAELMAVGAPAWAVTLVVLAGVIPAGCLQLNFQNRGLRLYMQTIFFPVSTSFLLLANMLYGTIFYQDYVGFISSPVRTVLFCTGVVLIMVGINLFQLRKPLELPSKDCECNEAATEEGRQRPRSKEST